MSDQSIPRDLSGPFEVAAYIASLSTELGTIARKAGFNTLEYLLEMVRLEAENLPRQAPPK
jgi:hypothetical protein